MTEVATLGLSVEGVSNIDRATSSLDRFAESGDRAERSVSGVGTESGRSAKSVDTLSTSSGRADTSLASLGRRAAGVAASLGLVVSASSVFRSMVATTSSFENSMAKVRAITRATDADMVRLSKTARELGASTVFSAAEAADGLQFLGMAGFNTEQAIAAIPGVLDLAASSAMGLAQTADIATNVMSGFSLAAAESGRVADILAAASSRANTDVAQLGDAMSTVAPIAAAMNISIEDTAAAIGVLSDAGIQGSRAGTSLRGVFAALAGPTTQAQKILARVGLTVQDINPEFSDLETVLGRLSTAGLSTADMMQIFGREAASGAIVLAEAAGRVGELGDELRGAEGEARRMAETMQDTLTGDTKELSSAIEELLLNLNDKTGLQAMLRGSTQRSTELVSGFNTLLNESELLNETLRLISSTAGALIDAVKLMVGGIVDAVRGFGDMIGAVKLAEASLPGLTRAVRFFADGIQDASIWLQFFGNVVKGAFSGDVRTIQNSWAQLQEAFKERVAERETRRLNDAVEDLLKNTDLFGTFEGAVTDAVGQLAEDAVAAAGGVEELDDELQKLIKSLQSLVDSYDKSGARVRQLIKDHAGLQQAMAMGLPGAKEAMDEYYDSLITVERRTTELAVATEESADWMATAFERGVERMRDGIGDFFERMIVDGKASFSDLTDLFKKMIAEMIATAAANRIMIGLGFAGAAGGASAGGLGSGGGGIGLSELLSMRNLASTVQGGFAKVGSGSLTAINWVGETGAQALYRLGYQQAASAWSTGASTFANGIVNAGQQVGGWFGASGMSANTAAGIGSLATAGAGWAGGRVGSDLGLALTGKEGSGWGAAGGATIGAIVGSYVPVVGTMLGSAIGGLIGGVVDSIFGTSGWNTTRGGLQLGFGDEGFDPMAWERQTKRGGLFGSTKRRYRFQDLPEEVASSLDETYNATLSSVEELYAAIGVSIEDGLLEGVRIGTLQIGTSGKSKQTEEEIERQIAEWFGELGDALAGAVDSALNFAQLQDLALSLTSLNQLLDAVGIATIEVSKVGAEAAQALIQVSGGLEAMVAQSDAYYQAFFTEQERVARLSAQLAGVFGELGYIMPATHSEFRTLVESLDLMTESGRQAFAVLMEIAPAFDQVATAGQAAAEEALQSARQSLQAAWANLERAVRNEQQSLREAWNVTRSSIQENIRTVQNAMRETERVANSLGRTLQTMRGNSLAFDPALQFSQASDYLRSVLASGGLGDQGELDRALAVVANPSAGTYETLVDYQRDFLQTAGVVEELESLTGRQLSAQDRSLQALERQLALAESQFNEEMARLDGVLERQALMIEAMLGQQDWLASINAGILSIPDAIAALGASIRDTQRVQREASMTPTERSVSQAYRDLLGREADAEGFAYWTAELVSGRLPTGQLIDTMRRVAIENGELQFAGGGIARGPSSGYIATLHGTEAVVPIPNGYIPVRMSGNDGVKQEIAQLREDLRNANRALIKSNEKMREILQMWNQTGMPEERDLQ